MWHIHAGRVTILLILENKTVLHKFMINSFNLLYLTLLTLTYILKT